MSRGASATPRSYKLREIAALRVAQRWTSTCKGCVPMRSIMVLGIIVSTVGLAAAEGNLPPRYVRGEVIIVHGTAPPVRAPAPKKNYHRMAPPYSEQAIMSDAWAKAWVLLDIDTRGVVTRVKLLKHPGYDLDQIAIEHALKMRFDPAEDTHGNPIPTQLVWSMEWPSYWRLVDMDEPPNRVPDSARYVPCSGSGPLHLGSLHPTYRDCSPADLSKMASEPWVVAK